MSGWLGNLLGSRTAVREGRDNPALQTAVQQAARIYSELPGRNSLDEAARQRLARQLYLDLHEIFSAASPVAVSRQKLAAQMLRFSLFQVLLIPPPPEPDVTGLRGLPGISGELNQHLESVVRNDSDLHAALYEAAVTEDSDAIAALLDAAYWQCFWCLETFNAARMDLGDTVPDRDWFRPFLFAACAHQENSYRVGINLPSAFEPQLAASAPVAYSLFADIVLAGATDPLLEWTEYHRDAGIPMPAFDDSTTLKY